MPNFKKCSLCSKSKISKNAKFTKAITFKNITLKYVRIIISTFVFHLYY